MSGFLVLLAFSLIAVGIGCVMTPTYEKRGALMLIAGFALGLIMEGLAP